MRLALLLAPLLLARCHCGADSLASVVCERPCYDGPKGTLGVGICHAGHPVCADNVPVACLDQQVPGRELCDGLDNDCDGTVDNHVVDVRVFTPCGHQNIGACRSGWTACVAGEVKCMGGTGPAEEDCSGTDRDCNGVTDDILPALCYDGDPHELIYPKTGCRAGYRRCMYGRAVCFGESLPRAEVCGDTMDWNCNGLVGDGPGVNNQVVDVVVVIDHDSALDNQRFAITDGLKMFTLAHAQDGYRFWVVDVPGHLQRAFPGEPTASLFSATPQEFIAALPDFYLPYGQMELPYEAFYRVFTSFPIQWQVGSSRFVVWFGDDNDCSDWNREYCPAVLGSSSMSAIANGFVANGITFISFASLSYPDYTPLALLTGGASYEISTQTSTTIRQALFERIGQPCQ